MMIIATALQPGCTMLATFSEESTQAHVDKGGEGGRGGGGGGGGEGRGGGGGGEGGGGGRGGGGGGDCSPPSFAGKDKSMWVGL